jgi:hypothetical protein
MGFFDSGIAQGLNQASDTLLRTGMGMMHYNQNKLIQDQAMKIRQEQADREKIAFERQEAAIKEQEAKYNAVVPASKYFPKIREFPSYRQSLIEGFKALNLPYEETPDGDIMGKYGHGQEVMQWIYASGERAEKQARGVYADLQTQKMAIIEQLKSVKKPEEAKALNEQLEALSLQQGQVLGSTWDVQKKMAEENNKKEEGLLVVGHDVLDKKTRKRVYRAPFAPTSSSQEAGKLTDIQKKRIDVLSSDIKNIDDQMKNTLAKDKPTLEAKRVKLEKERNDLLGIKPQAQPTFAQKPDASKYKGKIIVDTVTGKKEKSDGKNWVEIK